MVETRVFPADDPRAVPVFPQIFNSGNLAPIELKDVPPCLFLFP